MADAKHKSTMAYVNALVNPPAYTSNAVPYAYLSEKYTAYLHGAKQGWREGIQGYSDETSFDLSHAHESTQFREGYRLGLNEGKEYIATLKALAGE